MRRQLLQVVDLSRNAGGVEVRAGVSERQNAVALHPRAEERGGRAEQQTLFETGKQLCGGAATFDAQ